MAAKARARVLITRLMSTAGTGYYYTTKRLRVADKLAKMKYDPVGELFFSTFAHYWLVGLALASKDASEIMRSVEWCWSRYSEGEKRRPGLCWGRAFWKEQEEAWSAPDLITTCRKSRDVSASLFVKDC
ncbi:hypothetical protein IE81DRAFT_323164 [Ceraceosorus guamensis]|uniref:Large ribosomal subunit protein bL33m n=1 Tax=Ceraceosorus guamensis TaxID=1522189 RepID=A0A316W2L0_9BASI|nr:hypothetical protein IE81DRAFT_323164 [Ceraceosorus guamensis]PWN42811.1 hypothetical protein IE81DRAFT_323164 [Ceraceosorus guamensis]